MISGFRLTKLRIVLYKQGYVSNRNSPISNDEFIDVKNFQKYHLFVKIRNYIAIFKCSICFELVVIFEEFRSVEEILKCFRVCNKRKIVIETWKTTINTKNQMFGRRSVTICLFAWTISQIEWKRWISRQIKSLCFSFRF